jgi:hypothetical protein
MSDAELERWMAERVMGWHLRDYGIGGWWMDESNRWRRDARTWHPLTDANDALRVLFALGGMGWEFAIARKNVELSHEDNPDIWVDYEGMDLSRAICEAAHKAIGEVEP